MLDLLAAATTPVAAAGGDALTSLWSAEAAVALVTLTVLEVVLGVDNVLFISILANKLGPEQSDRARVTGLALAMVLRVALLLSITWIIGRTAAVPFVGERLAPALGDDRPFSWRDLILLVGGLFLIYKSVTEIHDRLEGSERVADAGRGASFAGVLVQVGIMDLIFGLDGVTAAVGMVQTAPQHRAVGLTVMILAIGIATGVMLVASGRIAGFLDRHPTVKMLALAFLVLIGAALIVDATHRHVAKGYVYFSMAFAIGVELLNLRFRKSKTQAPVHLKQKFLGERIAR